MFIKKNFFLIAIIFFSIKLLFATDFIDFKIKSIVREYSFKNFTFQYTLDEQRLPWIKIDGINNQKIDYSVVIPVKIELLAISPNAKVCINIIDYRCSQISSERIKEFFNKEGYYIPFNKFPSEVALLGEQGFLRFQKYQEIVVNPIIYRQDKLYYCPFVKLKIEWEDNWDGYEKIDYEESAFESVYKSAFINYSLDNGYKAKKRLAIRDEMNYNGSLAPPLGYKVKINEDGIYRLTYSELEEAGIPVDTVQPTTFQLYNRGIEIPIYVYGENDNKFDITDYIEFYGLRNRPEAGREEEFEGADYTDENVYWLYYGRALGKRVQNRDVAPINGYETPINYWYTKSYNPYGFFYSQVWQHGMSHWVWDFELKGPQSQCPPPPPPNNCNCSLCDPTGKKSFSFQLPDVDTTVLENASVSVKLLARSGSNLSYPDHHTVIHLNDCMNQDDAYWDGKINYYHQFTAPHSCLSEQNSLTLEIVGDVTNPDECCRDRVALDSITITYKKLFSANNNVIDFSYQNGNWRFVINNFEENNINLYDITDPYNPIMLTNFNAIYNQQWQLIFEDSINSENHYIAASNGAIKGPIEII